MRTEPLHRLLAASYPISVQALSEGGKHAMLGRSPLSTRADLRRWMTTTAVPILRAL